MRMGCRMRACSAHNAVEGFGGGRGYLEAGGGMAIRPGVEIMYKDIYQE
jgi:hypothetical protein